MVSLESKASIKHPRNRFYQFSHSGSYVNPIGPTRVISLKFRLVMSLLYFKNTVVLRIKSQKVNYILDTWTNSLHYFYKKSTRTTNENLKARGFKALSDRRNMTHIPLNIKLHQPSLHYGIALPVCIITAARLISSDGYFIKLISLKFYERPGKSQHYQ